MLGVYVSVPIACFRKGLAREFLETEEVPPPSTCYGFLLSLVGETDRRRHVGCRVTVAMLGAPQVSVVLRTLWRVKSKPLGSSGNTRPDFQQLLTHVQAVVWLDSTDETHGGETLETRVATALDPATRGRISRFGGLCLGESTHMVDEASPLSPARRDALKLAHPDADRRLFRLHDHGRLSLPVWVDHVGAAATRHAVGNLEPGHDLTPPPPAAMPVISPD